MLLAAEAADREGGVRAIGDHGDPQAEELGGRMKDHGGGRLASSVRTARVGPGQRGSWGPGAEPKDRRAERRWQTAEGWR